jgi:hypothetical protein
MANSPTSHLWRKYVRLSLRALIVAVLIIASLLGWVVHQAQVQRDAVAAIKNVGGTVKYDWEARNNRLIPSGKPRWPKWLVDLLGVDVFGHVTMVYVAKGGSDQELVQIGHLSRLEGMGFSGSSVTDAGVMHLKGLLGLQHLSLPNTPITSAGMVALDGLINLQSLGLEGTRINDEGLAHLEGLTRLETLILQDTKITGSGLASLKGHVRLRRLRLGNTLVGGNELANLEGLSSLEDLHLDETPITDAGLRHLRGLTNLRRLNLFVTRISGTGVDPPRGTEQAHDVDPVPIAGRGLRAEAFEERDRSGYTPLA